jgi:hypothetical protein
MRENYMDNGKGSLPKQLNEREYRSVILSYRIYNRLPQNEKVEFDRNFLNYPPLIGSLALFLWKYYQGRVKMQKILFIKAQRDLLDLFDKANTKFVGYLPKERFLKKALLFQGFVSLEKVKIRKAYAYIMTNRMIENKIWVYPIRLADNYKTMKKGKYKFYTECFGKVGIPGITKIKYSYE